MKVFVNTILNLAGILCGVLALHFFKKFWVNDSNLSALCCVWFTSGFLSYIILLTKPISEQYKDIFKK